jgi:hypothetical protein
MRMKRGAEAWAKSRKVHERIVGKFEGMRRSSTGGAVGGSASLGGAGVGVKKTRRSLDAPSATAVAKGSRRVSELRREW